MIWLACLCLLALTIAFNIEHIAIRYHHWRMMKNQAEWRTSGSRYAYEKHRDALVSLGYFEKKEFKLRHITSGSPESKALFQSLDARFPLIDWSSVYAPGEPCTMFVWATPGEMAMVTRFIAGADREK